MRWFQEYRSFLSRVVLGLLLAGAVYFLTEFFGVGASRHEREVIFSLGARPVSRLVVTYLSPGEDVLRVADLSVKGGEARDVTQMEAGAYQLEIVVYPPDGQAEVERRALMFGEEEQLWVDLRE